ncbi:hypothetical protein J2W42_006669 [Rhizobium tibeticum]|uniref:beta-galactosidase trimerization domain-containing protein n=1 Tax=Rhizobium tibeticum TaxID=501024 RepID=UPI002787F3C2|nr:beta-galactosidase trimerization domain-containing protein [Rhizobium tibeticum]MDP9813793.1 hypothetical protein [Rhizobium tibeticum]
MRFRQIHLDFHTSGQIPDIGSKFDPDSFGKAFQAAHVDSVTVFSKCHHGYSYHPTAVGRTHPGLKFDLLRAQIDALHQVGINAPVYLTATWDELAATEHPEWRTISPDGRQHMFSPELANGVGWAFLDFSTPYLDYLCAQTEEVMRNYPEADGIFMDIAFQLPSISTFARRGMEAQQLDWTDPTDRDRFTAWSVENFFTRIRDAVKKHDPRMPLFFNSGHVRRGLRKHYTDFYSHLELESLPTAGWGYEHFPLSARYVDPLGTPFLGQTGKFHTLWGEVGGYKHPDALLYECGAMLAQGARCCIGDHLHPTGKIDPSTMAIISSAYEWVEACEPWAVDSVNRADIALLSVEAARRPSLAGQPGTAVPEDEGAVRLLLECKFAFDVVDLDSDFAGYRLLILPDVVRVDGELKAKINDYVAAGGRVLLTGRSGIDPEMGFQFDCGAVWHGTSENSGGDYVLPIDDLQASFVHDPLFMYAPAERIVPTDGTSLGAVYEPYFDRTPRHFSGHIHTPCKPDPTEWAAGVQKGGFTYYAFPIVSAYLRVGAVAMLEIAERLILRALGGRPLLSTSLPKAGRATVRRQPGLNRDVVHLLHATPALRGNLRGVSIQPIQDLVTLDDVSVSVAISTEVASVTLVPQGQVLTFQQSQDRVSFSVPEVKGHQMVEIAYVTGG